MSTDRAAVGAVDLEAVRSARGTFDDLVKHTPVVSSVTLSERVGGSVALKAENLQRTGAFKIRGAISKLARLGADARGGVTTGSAGNHAQALAFAAAHRDVACEIYVPTGAPITKIEACEGLGATVIEVGAGVQDAVRASRQRAAESGMVFCHPFDDPAVVAGQGTIGLELLDDVGDLALVLVPLGGGGLLAGTAIAVKSVRPEVRIVGVQAAGCAPYAGGAVPDGPVATLADGIAVKSPGEVTGPLVERWVDAVVTVDEDTIADAMVLLMERAKLYVEGAGAVGVAALLSGAVEPASSGTTCCILSGGNVDLGVVPGLIRRHENQAGRRLTMFVRIDDRPGGLARLLSVVAETGANVIEVQHVREGLDLHVRESGIRATVEVRGPRHAATVIRDVAAAGYRVLDERRLLDEEISAHR